MTMYDGLSLLKNPPEIQAAIRAGNLPVSQGYLFAANLDCPDLRNSLLFIVDSNKKILIYCWFQATIMQLFIRY